MTSPGTHHAGSPAGPDRIAHLNEHTPGGLW